MLAEAEDCGLRISRELHQSLTDGTLARLHRSRNHVYRLKRPLDRPLVIVGRPTLVHPSVRARYQADSRYRLPALEHLLGTHGWEGIALAPVKTGIRPSLQTGTGQAPALQAEPLGD